MQTIAKLLEDQELFDVCLSVCARAQRTGQSDQFKTVKATDFKFDMHDACSQGQSRHDPLFFRKGGVCKNSLGGDTHCHERLLVHEAF